MIAARWDQRFATWAQSPSQTEATKIENTLTAVKNAIAADDKLADMTKVFVQGSYRNRVNVRQESDVDIGVLCTANIFGTQYPPNMGDSNFGLVTASYTYAEYKNDVGTALARHFGQRNVTRGDKAFDIHENTYRVDADVAPLLVHRRYSVDGSYICGTELHPDSGSRIVNWPEKLYEAAEWPNQHYESGNTKNNETRRSYRGVVRIIKKLRIVMAEDNVEAARPLKGFFIECLVWNVPNPCFAHATWREAVNAVLLFLATQTANSANCDDWREVSKLKWLFKGDEPKKTQARAFILAALRYLE
jgi:hypothetical protein